MRPAELGAGRELDALVAKFVMGWHASGSVTTYQAGKPEVVATWRETGDEAPAFSTDIAAACTVFERCTFFTLDRNADGWMAQFSLGMRPSRGFGETAPLAICTAALSAVGHRLD